MIDPFHGQALYDRIKAQLVEVQGVFENMSHAEIEKYTDDDSRVILITADIFICKRLYNRTI